MAQSCLERKIIRENRSKSLVPLPTNPGDWIRMKAKLHQIQCNEDQFVELSDAWIPIRPEHNDYTTPLRKAYTLHDLERA